MLILAQLLNNQTKQTWPDIPPFPHFTTWFVLSRCIEGPDSTTFLYSYCQSLDLDNDRRVDLYDVAVYFTDEECLNSNCIRPEILLP